MKKNKLKKILIFLSATLGGAFAIMHLVSKASIEAAKQDEDLSKDTYVDEGVAKKYHKSTIYEKLMKPMFDKIISFIGLVLLAPIFGIVSLAIYIDDPGPIMFTQKRVGLNKKYFKIHKFRSMKTSTPKNMPTHMLSNPDQYITKVGKFLRKSSLDELPQIWDIFVGNMAIIGPRPALWNQEDLIAERDKYGANDIKPGLTGWAQINGRDELEIDVKASLDGEYVKKLKKNSLSGMIMDIKCAFGTVSSVLKSEGVVEGGTGEMGKTDENTIPYIARIDENVELNYSENKKILIAGAGSYIGESFKSYMSQWDNYEIDSLDTINDSWKEKDFSGYDVVYDVAGIAHVKETDANRQLYYDVNRDLAVALARKAKKDGVKQFVYLSSMSVYGLTAGTIDKNTRVNPINAYGKSKLEAEIELWKLNDDDFVVSIVRPPMVYGNGCKGNYQTLRKFALKIGVFPKYNNNRSMIFIDNLSSAIRGIIHYGKCGIYFPQNLEYICTYLLVNEIASINGKKLICFKCINFLIELLVKKVNVFKKVFGNLTYNKEMNVPSRWIDVKDSIKTIEKTETKYKKKIDDNSIDSIAGKKILFFAPAFFGYENIIADKMRQLGAEVDAYDGRSVTKSIDRALLKVSPKIFEKKSNDYYEKIIRDNKGKKYDYILIIKCDMTPERILEKFKKIYPEAKLCLYLYDSVKNIPGVTKKFKYFDTLHSFDMDDCEKYNELLFRPLFFADQFSNPEKKTDYKYDISFLGTIHSDRYAIVKEVQNIANKNDLKCYWFLYLQSKFIYYFYKITKKEFANTSLKDFSFDKMESEDIAKIVNDSSIILDMQHPKQTGLTMRTIEMIGMNKKIITTNESIKKYDFYNPNNICVIDRKKPLIDFVFIKKQYEPLDDELYKKYSIEQWVYDVLS